MFAMTRLKDNNIFNYNNQNKKYLIFDNRQHD